MVTFTFDPLAVVQLLIAFVMPLVVGLITKQSMSGGKKAVILAGLTLVTSLLTELARALSAGEVFDLGLALIAALPAFIVSASAHQGLWKPTGVTETVAELGVSDPAPRRAAEGWGDTPETPRPTDTEPVPPSAPTGDATTEPTVPRETSGEQTDQGKDHQ